MKANEIRIGNLVTEEKGRIFEINGIGSTGLNGHGSASAIIQGDPKVNYFIDNDFNKLMPIPLTEEWLLKLGFEILPSASTHNLTCAKTEGLTINTYTDKSANYWWLGYYHNKKKNRIEYVHQLQNLYFALTGEELILKRP